MKFARRFLHPSSMRTVLLGFAVIILAGAFLLSLPISHRDGNWYPFIDSLFTSTSAVCVTGLIVADTAVEFTLFGQIIILMLIQIGGLGFMAGSTLIFMMIGKRINLQQRLLIKETLSYYKLQGVVDVIRKVIIYTVVIEAVGALLLLIGFVPLFGFWHGLYKSVFLSVSAFCNAGFDVLGVAGSEFAGLTGYVSDVAVCLPIMMLVVTGGLGFGVLLELTSLHKNKRLSINAKIVLCATAALIIIGAVFYLVIEWDGAFKGLTTGDKVLAAIFQSITPRTAGFNTVDQADLSQPSVIMTYILMFIGASPSSTGGGIKTTTFVILMLTIYSTLVGKKGVHIDKKSIPESMIKKCLSIMMLAVCIIMSCTLLISIFEMRNAHETMTLENIIFESVSAFSTVGISRGITPHLSWMSKLVLSMTMFAGRLGPLTVGIALIKSARNDAKIAYPDAKIMIG